MPRSCQSLFAAVFFLLTVVRLTEVCGLAASEDPPRPNILFAIADDWGWPHAGRLGDKVVQTPTFDRLANEGILFEQAYVSSPSCTASRNAILTGQFHWRLGAGANLHSNLDPAFKTFPLLLEDAGYHVGHWRKSYGPGPLKGWERHPAGANYPKGFASFLKARPKDAPFCFWLGASDPHRTYVRDSGEASGMDLDAIALFAHFPDTRTVRGDVADYYFEVQRFDRDVANALKLLDATGELENTIIVMTGDHGMPFPRCKSNNYDCGVRVPLAIRWGENIRNPGRVVSDFVSLTDLAPTFLEVARCDPVEEMTGKSLTSLFQKEGAGVLEPERRGFVLHGKERHVPGQEGNLGGYPVRALRTSKWLYVRNYEPERWPSGTPNYEQAAIRNAWLADCDNGPSKWEIAQGRSGDAAAQEFWRLSFAKRPAEELYDCENDPHQLDNLASDPAFAATLRALSGQLTDNLRNTGDPRVTGPAVDFDAFPYHGGAPRYPGPQGIPENPKKKSAKTDSRTSPAASASQSTQPTEKKLPLGGR